MTTRKKPSVTGLRQWRGVGTTWLNPSWIHFALPLPMWIPTLLGRGWVETTLSYAQSTGLRMMNGYNRWLHQSSIRPLCQWWILQSSVCQTPAGQSEWLGAARRSLTEMVVCTTVILPQSSITILLLDEWRRRWNYTTEHVFAVFSTVIKPPAQLLRRRLCVVATATLLWITSSHLQLRIWLTILGRNLMMMLGHGAQIQEACRQQKQVFKCLNRSFKGGLSDSSDTLKSSDTVLLAFCPLWPKCCWWCGCGLALHAQSHCECSRCRLFGQ